MSIEALKNSLEDYENAHPLFFQHNEQAAKKHLILLSKCLLDLYKVVQPELFEEKDDEPWMTLMAFYEKTHLCHPSTLARLMNTDLIFFRSCGQKRGSKFYIKENKAIKYLTKSDLPKVSKRAIKLLNAMQQKEIEPESPKMTSIAG